MALELDPRVTRPSIAATSVCNRSENSCGPVACIPRRPHLPPLDTGVVTSQRGLKLSYAQQDDTAHHPGDPAPKSGIYRMLNVFGAPTRTFSYIDRGVALPRVSCGFSWRLEDETDEPAAGGFNQC